MPQTQCLLVLFFTTVGGLTSDKTHHSSERDIQGELKEEIEFRLDSSSFELTLHRPLTHTPWTEAWRRAPVQLSSFGQLSRRIRNYSSRPIATRGRPSLAQRKPS